MTVGLTPALIAQFLPVNTVDAGTNGISFPNSNVLSMSKFVPLNFQGRRQHDILAGTCRSTPDGRTSRCHPAVDAVDHDHLGDQQRYASDIQDRLRSRRAVALCAVEFERRNSRRRVLRANSVLYNLAGQQVGYSSNFVTDATSRRPSRS